MIRKSTPKELFAASFKDLARSKSVSKITVQDIVSNCEYSAATFYREFHDKYDLIAWDYAQDVDRIMSQIGHGGYTWRRTLGEGAEYHLSHRPYLLNLLSHTAGHDAFACCMMKTNYAALKDCVLGYAGQGGIGQTEDLCLRLYVSGTVHLCCEWLAGRISAEPAEMAAVWEDALPSPLHRYLYPAG